MLTRTKVNADIKQTDLAKFPPEEPVLGQQH